MGRKNNRGNSIPRAVFVGLSLALQIGWLLIRIVKLNEYSAVISVLTGFLALAVVLRLYSDSTTTSAMKMPWILLIALFPVMGLSLYLMMEVFGDTGKRGKQFSAIQQELRKFFQQKEEVLQEIWQRDPAVGGQCRYLWEKTDAPVYENTAVQYFGDAADAFDALKREAEKAESFIFLEYFIVQEGSAWQELQQILARKAKQGVEVRLMYDDIGSIGCVNLAFMKQMNGLGIRCKVFNPALPFLNLFMNHRDHRKIAVFDGKIAFAGGFNLSDEYFGRSFPYGKWKDTGIRLEGEAVRSMTAEFLEMWNMGERNNDAYGKYLTTQHSMPEATGFVQPYADDPLGKERTAENVYLNLISSAHETLWLMTPYLIISDEMNRALGLAAKRGVDVRIITPGIPDKKAVYAVTRSYYGALAANGVRIFEWKPGFCHAKQCLCDRRAASIGTSNLDYRSLYHHFENNVLLYDCDAVEQMAEDFENTFTKCREMTPLYQGGRNSALFLWQCVLRLFAPLL